MSLLGAIETYYQTSSDSTVVALREAVGPALFADTMPNIYTVDEDDEPTLIESAFPYVVLTQGDRAIQVQVKANPGSTWVEGVPVTFSIMGTSRNQVETILDQLEEIFLPVADVAPVLTLSNRDHLATYPGTSNIALASSTNADIWQGSLELAFELGRGG